MELLWTEDLPAPKLRQAGGLWASDTVTNYYNTARMRIGLGLAQSTGAWTNGFTYDAAHRLATVISPAVAFTYTYKAAGNLVTNLALPNTSRITNAFDSVGRLTSTRLLTSEAQRAQRRNVFSWCCLRSFAAGDCAGRQDFSR